MLLKGLHYKEHEGESSHWEVDGLVFDRVNLLVGKNATGKTRVMNILKNVAREITGEVQRLFDGEWKLTFENSQSQECIFACSVYEAKVASEEMSIGGETVLSRRRGGQTSIKNMTTGETKDYQPPDERLTVHVRRDKKEYPFLEDLHEWAYNYHAFMFSSTAPNQVFQAPQGDDTPRLESLAAVPHLLMAGLENKSFISAIIEDVRRVGYALDKIGARHLLAEGLPRAWAVVVHEDDLTCDTDQTGMSAGMYRAFATVVIVHHLLRLDRPCTLAMDDIGEGLDFDRCRNLVDLVQERCKDTDIQLILTSNDRHLLNAVDVRYWNLLERAGGQVRSYNYANSKEAFDEFRMTGLSNFDFLTSEMYKGPALVTK